jgi:hypothetical protein
VATPTDLLTRVDQTVKEMVDQKQWWEGLAKELQVDIEKLDD